MLQLERKRVTIYICTEGICEPLEFLNALNWFSRDNILHAHDNHVLLPRDPKPHSKETVY